VLVIRRALALALAAPLRQKCRSRPQ